MARIKINKADVLACHLPTDIADAVLRANGLGTFSEAVDRVTARWDAATAADSAAGASWYGDDSGALIDDLVALAGDHGITINRVTAAVILSHLSPRTTWKRNVAGARALVSGEVAGKGGVGCMTDNVARATAALLYTGDARETFGDDAHKTRSFARNLLGDRDAVTVDVWAARVAFPADVTGKDAELILKRVGVYAAIATAYRAAAIARGTDPATMQATTWIVARNGRAA